MDKDNQGIDQQTPTDEHNEDRRRFLKTAGKAAAVAPAVSLLISVEGAKAGDFGPYDRQPD